MGKELALMFNLEAGKDVCLRKVNREEVGIDLLELRFKVGVCTRVRACMYMYIYVCV